MVKYLVDKGADVNQVCETKKTSLFYANDIDSLAFVKELLKHEAGLEHRDSYRRSPLFYASLQNRSGIVKFLADKGVDVSFATSDGSTPLRVAKERGYQILADILITLNAKKKGLILSEPKLILPSGMNDFYEISISNNGKFVFSPSGYILDSRTGKIIRKKDVSYFRDGRFSPDNNSVIYICNGKIIYSDIIRKEPVKEIFYPPSEGIEVFPESGKYIFKVPYTNWTYAKLTDEILNDGSFQSVSLSGNERYNVNPCTIQQPIAYFSDTSSNLRISTPLNLHLNLDLLTNVEIKFYSNLIFIVL